MLCPRHHPQAYRCGVYFHVGGFDAVRTDVHPDASSFPRPLRLSLSFRSTTPHFFLLTPIISSRVSLMDSFLYPAGVYWVAGGQVVAAEHENGGAGVGDGVLLLNRCVVSLSYRNISGSLWLSRSPSHSPLSVSIIKIRFFCFPLSSPFIPPPSLDTMCEHRRVFKLFTSLLHRRGC